MRTIRNALLVLALGGALIACKPAADEAQDDAVEAQREANRAIRSAEQQAAETAAQARKEAEKAAAEGSQKVAEANQEAREKTAEAQAEANEDIREAKADKMEAGDVSELRVWAQRKVDDLSNEIDQVAAKAQKAPAKGRAQLENELNELRKSRDQLLKDLSNLDTRVAANTASFRASLDERISRLKDRIDKLERSL